MEQTEYMLGYGLTAAMVVLGMLIVCVPRPRKKADLTKDQIAKQKKKLAKEKASAKAKKAANRKRKKAKKK